MASRKLLLAYALFLSVLVIYGCMRAFDVNYPHGVFPSGVTRFDDLNSRYDDFNSGPPPEREDYNLYWGVGLFFSSNRVTQGGAYDIERASVWAVFNQVDGAFEMWGSVDHREMQSGGTFPTPNTWPGMDTAFSEYGPYLMELQDNRTMYLHASDADGDLDIYYTVGEDSSRERANALNSDYDDAYPTFGTDNRFYFTSNRSGDFNIYSAAVPDNTDIPSWLTTSSPAAAITVDSVNSSDDDKCPFIKGGLLVFTSNRPGGYGGFDLYYSIYGPDGWSAPVNFGPSINSFHDEYRPVVLASHLFANDLMIFSSNRPGGMGGFDLYYVGIPKMVAEPQ